MRFVAGMILCMLPMYASYLSVSQKELSYKTAFADRMKKSRVRMSNSTKIVKIIYMDTKRLSFATTRQRNTSDLTKGQKSF